MFPGRRLQSRVVAHATPRERSRDRFEPQPLQRGAREKLPFVAAHAVVFRKFSGKFLGKSPEPFEGRPANQEIAAPKTIVKQARRDRGAQEYRAPGIFSIARRIVTRKAIDEATEYVGTAVHCGGYEGADFVGLRVIVGIHEKQVIAVRCGGGRVARRAGRSVRVRNQLPALLAEP